MYSTIVVGTDGSKDAEQAIAAAAELASKNREASVHVVSAYRPLSAADLERLSAQLPDEFRPLLSPRIGPEHALAQAAMTLQKADVVADYHQAEGDPTDALLDAADRLKADLIVVGSRGEGLTKRALHGSVSTKILHHAPCAVLVVKGDR